VAVLLQVLATLPVTTATAERSFSTLKRLKTYLRSSMVDDRLTSLALIHVHAETIPVDAAEVIDKSAFSDLHKLFFALKLFNCTVIEIMTMFVVPTIDVFRFSKHTMANSKKQNGLQANRTADWVFVTLGHLHCD